MLQYIDTQKKELCCGCRACEQICHVHAIIMKEDEEGFLYPHLNMNLCTQCGLCEKVCPISEPILVSSEIANMQVYAAMTRDVELRKKSSSGGLFSEIASVILHAEGGVYGAAFDREFRLKHVGVFLKRSWIDYAVQNTFKVIRGRHFLKFGICYDKGNQYIIRERPVKLPD